MDKQVEIIIKTAAQSDTDWLSAKTVVCLAQDMKNANSDTAMDEEFDDLCDEVIVRYSK
jgi:hypothetical protein